MHRPRVVSRLSTHCPFPWWFPSSNEHQMDQMNSTAFQCTLTVTYIDEIRSPPERQRPRKWRAIGSPLKLGDVSKADMCMMQEIKFGYRKRWGLGDCRTLSSSSDHLKAAACST